MPTDKDIAELLERQRGFCGPIHLSESEEQVILEIKSKDWYGEKFKDKQRWGGVTMPLVRRVFSSLLSQELVSVQPMSAPAGNLFYLDYKIDKKEQNNDDVPRRYIMGVDPIENNTKKPLWGDTIMT